MYLYVHFILALERDQLFFQYQFAYLYLVTYGILKCVVAPLRDRLSKL